jgi:hypothetical protein
MTEQGEGRCPHCGGTELVRGLELNLTAEVGAIGFPYRAAWKFHGTEPLLADLCRACGTVVRLFVQDTGRKWVQKS